MGNLRTTCARSDAGASVSTGETKMQKMFFEKSAPEINSFKGGPNSSVSNDPGLVGSAIQLPGTRVDPTSWMNWHKVVTP